MNDTKFLRHLCIFLSQKAIGNKLYREKHTEAADFLGVTYRHLLYVLADFVRCGYLKKTEQGYSIQDLTALRNIAEGNEM